MAEVKEQYRVINPGSLEDLANQVNRIFAMMADRADGQEGRRGDPKFYNHVDFGNKKGTNVADGSNSADIATIGHVDSEVAAILQYNKPIGTIHISINPANPATYLGYGTWTAFGTGRVLVGYDGTDADFNPVEKTGGSKTIADHTHTIPDHEHPDGTTCDQDGTGLTVQVKDGVETGLSTDAAGTASVVQPYIVVYMWKRTA